MSRKPSRGILCIVDAIGLVAIIFVFVCSPNSSNYVIDHFERTRPMSTFTFGFVISQLSEVNRTYHTAIEKPVLRIYGRKDFHKEISVKLFIHFFLKGSNRFLFIFVFNSECLRKGGCDIEFVAPLLGH